MQCTCIKIGKEHDLALDVIPAPRRLSCLQSSQLLHGKSFTVCLWHRLIWRAQASCLFLQETSFWEQCQRQAGFYTCLNYLDA